MDEGQKGRPPNGTCKSGQTSMLQNSAAPQVVDNTFSHEHWLGSPQLSRMWTLELRVWFLNMMRNLDGAHLSSSRTCRVPLVHVLHATRAATSHVRTPHEMVRLMCQWQ
eukprot:6265672-Amphidinium_carterae.1